MAVTITGSASAGSTSSATTSLTVSHTANGDDLLVFLGTYNGLPYWEIPTVTYGGVAMHPIARDVPGGTGDGLLLYRMTAAPAGTANVAVSTGGFVYWMTVGAINVSGLGGVRFTKSAKGSSFSASVTVQSLSGDLVIDCVLSGDVSQNWTPGAGQTQVYEQITATNVEKSAVSYKAATGSSETMSQSLAVSGAWYAYAFSLAPSGAGGGGGATTHGAAHA